MSLVPTFALADFTPCKILDYNPRSELTGQETRAAGDLKVQVKLPNTILAFFGSQLRASIYWNNGEAAQQAEIVPGVVEDIPNLRNPKMMMPIRIDHELVGAVATLDYGLGGRSNLVLGEVKVNAFSLDCQEGGTVVVVFRIQCHPDEKTAGKLCAMIGNEGKIKIIPAEDTQQDALEKQTA